MCIPDSRRQQGEPVLLNLGKGGSNRLDIRAFWLILRDVFKYFLFIFCNVVIVAITTVATKNWEIQNSNCNKNCICCNSCMMFHGVVWMHIKFLKQAFHISMIEAMTIFDNGQLLKC